MPNYCGKTHCQKSSLAEPFGRPIAHKPFLRKTLWQNLLANLLRTNPFSERLFGEAPWQTFCAQTLSQKTLWQDLLACAQTQAHQPKRTLVMLTNSVDGINLFAKRYNPIPDSLLFLSTNCFLANSLSLLHFSILAK